MEAELTAQAAEQVAGQVAEQVAEQERDKSSCRPYRPHFGFVSRIFLVHVQSGGARYGPLLGDHSRRIRSRRRESGQASNLEARGRC